jgi:MSHA pilin protein MshA
MSLKTQKVTLKKNEKGFTLVEVIAVLVILGILAAVAVPKFFDMQATARTKALQGAVGELNGQVALAFAQRALQGFTDGDYDGLSCYLGPDFEIKIPGTGAATTSASSFNIASLESGTIALSATPTETTVLTWTAGSTDSPGYFSLP